MSNRSAPRNAVCLCVDRRMMIPAMFVAKSILSKAGPGRNPFDVLVFAEEAEVTDVQREWMRTNGIGLRTDIDLSAYHGLFNPGNRISAATLTRLFLPSILEETHDRILYLDADLTIHGDVSRIFPLDLGDHAFAAVRSGTAFRKGEKERAEKEAHFANLGMTKPYRYFNSGVLLIDIRKWLDRRISENAMEFLRTSFDKCYLPDEDALNATVDGDFCGMSPVWNMAPTRTPEDYRRTGPYMPVILHHMGRAKPWRLFIRHRHMRIGWYYYGLYRDFLKDTPWRDWLAGNWTFGDFTRNLEWELVESVRRFTRRADRRAFAEQRARYSREEPFADLEQGIVVRDGGVMRLAD